MKRTLVSRVLAMLFVLLLIAGCAAKTAVPLPAQPESMPRLAPAATMAPGARSLASAAGSAPKDGYLTQSEAVASDRKIILTTNLQLTVQETEKTVAAIKGLVAEQSGYVASANVWHEGNLLRAHLSVRVPAPHLDAFLAQVKRLAVRVEREEASGQDVTEEYVDLQAQIGNLESAEKELRELLTVAREKAGKAEDIMAVYRELSNVRGQIDRLKGRQQYLERMVEMATINLELNERQPEPIGKPGWQPGQTMRRALSALVQAGKFGVDALIWLAFFGLPLLIVPVLIIVAIWFFSRRRRAEQAKAQWTPPATKDDSAS